MEREDHKNEMMNMLQDGLGKQLQLIAASYVIPICWIASQNGLPKMLDSGSAFMIDCGAGPFVVTANHVYQGYLRDREIYNDAVCLLGEIKINLEERFISSDAAYDVATFHILDSEILALKKGENSKIVLTGSQKAWPPKPPEVGKGVFFVGFPGGGRKLRPYKGDSEVHIDWLGYTALATASSVSDANITLFFNHQSSIDIGKRDSAPSDVELGGCSGAPILTLVENASIFTWRLGGIIYESGTMCGSTKIIKAARADCLNADGTVNRHPDPMAYSNRS